MPQRVILWGVLFCDRQDQAFVYPMARRHGGGCYCFSFLGDLEPFSDTGYCSLTMKL
jgi:hypothetical protein